MLNYLPLRNVLIQGIKATVKNKALPDSARLGCTPVSHSLSLSLVILRLGPIKAGLMHLLSLSPMPFILRVPPGSCRGWTPYSSILTASRACQHL